MHKLLDPAVADPSQTLVLRAGLARELQAIFARQAGLRLLNERSYFAECERDKAGHCEGSGGETVGHPGWVPAFEGAKALLAGVNALADKIPIVKHIKAAMTAAALKVYSTLEARYGPKVAKACLAAGQATAWGALGAKMYLPGSTVWGPLPFAGLAEAGLQLGNLEKHLQGSESIGHAAAGLVKEMGAAVKGVGEALAPGRKTQPKTGWEDLGKGKPIPAGQPTGTPHSAPVPQPERIPIGGRAHNAEPTPDDIKRLGEEFHRELQKELEKFLREHPDEAREAEKELRRLGPQQRNAFCPTGEGGGHRNDCAPNERNRPETLAAAKAGDKAVVAEIVEQNQGLVKKLAKGWAGKDRDLFDELVSEGNLGLLRAAQKFDPERGFKFSTYAHHWVDGKMRNLITKRQKQKEAEGATIVAEPAAPKEKEHAGGGVIPHSVHEALGQIEPRLADVIKSLYGLGGADKQTGDQLAQRLGVTKGRISQMKAEAVRQLKEKSATANALVWVENLADEYPLTENWCNQHGGDTCTGGERQEGTDKPAGMLSRFGARLNALADKVPGLRHVKRGVGKLMGGIHARLEARYGRKAATAIMVSGGLGGYGVAGAAFLLTGVPGIPVVNDLISIAAHTAVAEVKLQLGKLRGKLTGNAEEESFDPRWLKARQAEVRAELEAGVRKLAAEAEHQVAEGLRGQPALREETFKLVGEWKRANHGNGAGGPAGAGRLRPVAGVGNAQAAGGVLTHNANDFFSTCTRDEKGYCTSGEGEGGEVKPAVRPVHDPKFIATKIQEAVAERPSRMNHGDTGNNAFIIYDDGKILSWDAPGRRELRGGHMVHSHSGDLPEPGKPDLDFLPHNSADVKILLDGLKAGDKTASTVIMRDGRMETLRLSPTATPKQKKALAKLKPKQLKIDLDPTYEERLKAYKERGIKSHDLAREQLTQFAKHYGLEYTLSNWKTPTGNSALTEPELDSIWGAPGTVMVDQRTGLPYLRNSLTENPFVSEAQRKACWAADDPAWDCKEWESKTKGKLPERKAENADGWVTLEGGQHVFMKGGKVQPGGPANVRYNPATGAGRLATTAGDGQMVFAGDCTGVKAGGSRKEPCGFKSRRPVPSTNESDDIYEAYPAELVLPGGTESRGSELSISRVRQGRHDTRTVNQAHRASSRSMGQVRRVPGQAALRREVARATQHWALQAWRQGLARAYDEAVPARLRRAMPQLFMPAVTAWANVDGKPAKVITQPAADPDTYMAGGRDEFLRANMRRLPAFLLRRLKAAGKDNLPAAVAEGQALIAAAQAAGQLVGFRALGVAEVALRLCQKCRGAFPEAQFASDAGIEAMVPRKPGCLCAWRASTSLIQPRVFNRLTYNWCNQYGGTTCKGGGKGGGKASSSESESSVPPPKETIEPSKVQQSYIDDAARVADSDTVKGRVERLERKMTERDAAWSKVHEKVAAIDAKLGKLERAHQRITDKMNKMMDADAASMKAGNGAKHTSDEYTALGLKADEALGKFLKARRLRDEAAWKIIRMHVGAEDTHFETGFTSLKKVSLRENTSGNPAHDLTNSQKDSVATVVKVLSGAVSVGLAQRIMDTDVRRIPEGEEQRAHFKGTRHGGDGQSIYITTTSSEGTVAHELGHSLEGNAGIHAAAQGFLYSRVGKEAARHMGAGFNDWEVGRDDDFAKAFGGSARYVGKHYKSEDTEVVSMGLEKMYNDPVHFAKTDPKYFKFILGVLDGSFA